MIISVPHSGTRSLREHLARYGYWHFGQNDADIANYDGRADIPIRNPVDIAVSWEARYQDNGDKTADNLIWRLDAMLNYIDSHDVKIWNIEEIPVFARSIGPDHSVRKTRTGSRIDAVRKWLSGDILGFYEGIGCHLSS